MPGRYKSHHADEYESDDLETADTLIGRNRVPASKKKPRPTSASTKKKPPRRPVTPGKKKRAQSAPSARSGHELWMNAVKNRLTVGLASNRRPQSPRHKTTSEFWIDTLRKTGQGYTTESTGMNTFSGKRPRDKDMPYLSTPSYLRHKAGTEKPGKMFDPTMKSSPGTPHYKSQEEYYEQILEYKKQMGSLNQDVSTMKAKIRRLEEDNLKKEKEIDCLLHPQKSEELRRTLTDKRPDTGSVIHSLKQKILKLETQLRDKETSYIKLQSELKTTKVDEMKQQMEVFYQEIVRLQNSKDTGMDKPARSGGRDGTIKVKALNETILRLSRSNEQLQSENRSLKEDLKHSLEDSRDRSPSSKTLSTSKSYMIPGVKKEYEDMNRKELLRTIGQLEKKVERSERHMDGSSIVSYESKAPAMQGKVALDGSLEDRLDQLDKRESELLELLEKKNTKVKQLTEEKSRWKRRCDDLEKMLGTSHVDYDYSADSRSERPRRQSPNGSRPPSSRPLSARRESHRPLSARSDSERPLSARDRLHSGRPDRQERPISGRSERSSRPPSAKRRTSIDSGISSVRKRKIEQFRENKSAKTIQKHWRSHQQDKKLQNEKKVEQFRENYAAKKIQKHWTGFQYKKHEQERDDAADLIRSSLLGHSTRRQQMAMYRSETETDDDYETDNEEYNDCVNLIQSAMKGHQSRKTHMRNTRLSSTGEDYYDDDDNDDIMESPKRSFSSSLRSNNRPQSPSVYRSRPQSGLSGSIRSRTSISSGKGPASRSQTTYNRQTSHSNLLDSDDDGF